MPLIFECQMFHTLIMSIERGDFTPFTYTLGGRFDKIELLPDLSIALSSRNINPVPHYGLQVPKAVEYSDV